MVRAAAPRAAPRLPSCPSAAGVRRATGAPPAPNPPLPDRCCRKTRKEEAGGAAGWAPPLQGPLGPARASWGRPQPRWLLVGNRWKRSLHAARDEKLPRQSFVCTYSQHVPPPSPRLASWSAACAPSSGLSSSLTGLCLCQASPLTFLRAWFPHYITCCCPYPGTGLILDN